MSDYLSGHKENFKLMTGYYFRFFLGKKGENVRPRKLSFF